MRTVQTWVYIGYFNQWIQSPIPTSHIYQLTDAAPTLPLSDYISSEKYTKQQQCFSVLNLQGRCELMKSTWMGQWTRIWVKVEKAQGQTMK